MQINKLQINYKINEFTINNENKLNYFETYSSRIIHSMLYNGIYTFIESLVDNSETVLLKLRELQNESLIEEIINNDTFIKDFQDKKIGFNFNYYLSQKKHKEEYNSLSIFITSSSSLLLKILKFVLELEKNEDNIEYNFNYENNNINCNLKYLSSFDKSLKFELNYSNFELKICNFNYINQEDNKELYYNEESINFIINYLSNILNLNKEQILFNYNNFLKSMSKRINKENKYSTKTILLGSKNKYNLIPFKIINFSCILKNLTDIQEKKLEYWINEGFGNKNSFGFGSVDLSSYIKMNKYNNKINIKFNKRKNRLKELLC